MIRAAVLENVFGPSGRPSGDLRVFPRKLPGNCEGYSGISGNPPDVGARAQRPANPRILRQVVALARWWAATWRSPRFGSRAIS